MSRVFVTSDWHFGHKGVEKFRPQFKNHHHMEDVIMANALSVLTKRDKLICIGDMAFDRHGLDKMRELPCSLVLVRGNHDYLNALDYLTLFDDVHGAYYYDHAFITHIPIHPTELRGRVNVHGHCHAGGPREHRQGDDWRRYYNAILEVNDYRPVLWTHVTDVLEGNV